MRKGVLGLFVLLALVVGGAPSAQADTITLTVNGCTFCSGATPTVTITPTGTPNQYAVNLELGFDSYFAAWLAAQIAQLGCSGQGGGLACSASTMTLAGKNVKITWLVNLPPGANPNENLDLILSSSGLISLTVATATAPTSSTPEPGTLALFGLGAAAIGGAIRRRNRRQASSPPGV
jgi:hypothetical protein